MIKRQGFAAQQIYYVWAVQVSGQVGYGLESISLVFINDAFRTI